MKKIGLFGGTFNPIHIGHLVMAETALDQLALDQVIFIPSYWPPHKIYKNVVSAGKRLKMVKLAVSGHKKFAVSDCEVKRRGRSYTIDTARYFKAKYASKTRFYFIMGSDSASSLDQWKNVHQLEKLVVFVCLNRKGFKPTKTKIRIRNLFMPEIDISSSQVRRMVKAGQSVKFLVPDLTLKFIQKEKLYKK